MDYNTFRHLADSWGLVYLFAIFVVAICFALRPAAAKRHSEAAQIPFQED